MDILCPQCDATESAVIESRGNRRRRECSACQFRWSTYEVTGERLKKLEDAEKSLEHMTDLLRDPPDTIPAGLDGPAGLDIELPS